MILKAALTVCACKIRVEDKSRKGRKMRKVIRTVMLALITCFSATALGLNTTGLVAYWKLDETSGTTAYDSVGDDHGTLMNGPVWTEGKIGGALEFDGQNDLINVGDQADLELQELTLSFWAQLDNPSGSFQGGIAKGNVFGTVYYISYRISFHLGTVRAGVTNTSDQYFGDLGSVSDNDWHLYTMTVGNGDVTLYIDGQFEFTVPYTGPIDYTKVQNRFLIGAEYDGDYSFDGKMDDIRVYNVALSYEEVNELYQYGIVEPNLIGLEIEGPNEVAEESSVQYSAIAVYDNNSTKDVTNEVYWEVMPDNYADINDSGLLTTDQLVMPTEDVTIYAEYEEGNDIAHAEKDVQINAICPDGALEFDGEDDYVNLGTSDSIKPSLPLTLSAWINLSNLDTHNRILALDINIDRYYGVWFKVKTDNTLEISYGDGGGTGSGSRRSKFGMTELDKDIWYHVAAVIRGPENINLYIDGKDDGGIYSGSGGPLAYSDGFSSIGYNYAPHIFFYGNIDEVTIFNRGLSGEDIQTVMLYGPDTSDTSLVGYWKFDEGQGQVAHNSSGNANDGYLGSDPCNPDDSDPCWVEPGAPVHCTPRQIVVRNLRGAIERKAIANQQINEALERERASIRLLMRNMRGRRHFAIEIQKSMQMEDLCKKKLHESAEALRRALDWLLDNAIPQ